MWYLEDSRARTSAPPAKEPASQAIDQDCGWKWQESSVKYDPGTRLWRTRQDSLLKDSGWFSETWPRWGFVVPGVCLEPLTLGHRTSEKESGLLENQSHEQDASIHKAISRIVLSTVWSKDGKTAFLKWQAGRLGAIYEAEVLLEEMPRRITHKDHRNGRPIQIPRTDAAGGLLRTLRICEEFTSASQGQEFIQQHAYEFADALRELSQHIALAGAEGEWTVRLEWRSCERPMSERHILERESGLLPTVTATDHKGSTQYQVQRRSMKGNGLTLREWLAKYSNATETVYPDPGLLEKVMGWPAGWTELKQLETDKCHNAQQQHGEY